jgi:hypothetical protein
MREGLKKAGKILFWTFFWTLWIGVKFVEGVFSIFDLYDDHADRMINARYHGDKELARLNGDYWA